MRIDTFDLEFQGTRHVIAAFLVHGPKGPVLVETGPGTTLPTLVARLERQGLRPADVRDVLVTHIHLDHAGAAGWWARQGARVHVHPAGAPHLIDPAKLLASATRIYGDLMEKYWGEVLPAPADRIVVVEDGETFEVGGLEFTAIDTPGHARHHHVFQLGDVAFAGDAAGILPPNNSWIDLLAPPPEFDLVAWKGSLDRLRGLGLRTLYRTHFDATSDVEAELARFEELLEKGVDSIQEMLDRGLNRQQMIEEFGAQMRVWAIETGMSEADARAYELANPRSMSVDGIARYCRKRRSSS